jgi:adenylate cyclase
MSISEQDIRQHLNSILEGHEFKDRPALQSFLRFLVDMALSGRSHQIKGYTVATQVFGRGQDFEPMRDAIVRVQAGRLRSALERYYQRHTGQLPIRIRIPKGSYVPIFEENHREGIPPDEPPAASVKGLEEAVPGPTIAVMPLLNLSGDPSEDYFTDGLTQEMVGELARYQELRVIASHSTLRWKHREFDPREVGRELGVRFLVAGSMRKDIDTIKISVWLVDTSTGMQIWGDQYRRPLAADSLIAVQEDIGRRVAAKVGSEYGIVPRTLSQESRRKPPEALETYEAYLRFFHYMSLLSPQTYSEALCAMECATTREPNSGLAWSMLALLYLHNHSLELSAAETPLDRALGFAQRGASIEPQNQLVRHSLANVYFLLDERDLFLQEENEALRLNPNSSFLTGAIGWLMALYGEWKRGLAILRRAIELNPYYPGWFHVAPYLDHYRQGKYPAAYREAQQLNMPFLFWDPLLRAAALGQMGKKAEAGKATAELLQLRPDFAASARRLIGYYVKTASLVDALLDGLRKAGLAIGPTFM